MLSRFSFLNQSCLISYSSRLKVHWLKNILGQKGALCFIYEQLRGCWRASLLAWCWDVPADAHKQAGMDSNNWQRESEQQAEDRQNEWWGLKRTRKGEMEEGEEGHEVGWERSELTTGEYTGVQRSHEGLMQPLNTGHVSHCAAHTHPSLPLSQLLNPNPHTNTHKLNTLHTVIGINPQFFPLHIKSDNWRCSECGTLPASSYRTPGTVHM